MAAAIVDATAVGGRVFDIVVDAGSASPGGRSLSEDVARQVGARAPPALITPPSATPTSSFAAAPVFAPRSAGAVGARDAVVQREQRSRQPPRPPNSNGATATGGVLRDAGAVNIEPSPSMANKSSSCAPRIASCAQSFHTEDEGVVDPSDDDVGEEGSQPRRSAAPSSRAPQERVSCHAGGRHEATAASASTGGSIDAARSGATTCTAASHQYPLAQACVHALTAESEDDGVRSPRTPLSPSEGARRMAFAASGDPNRCSVTGLNVPDSADSNSGAITPAPDLAPTPAAPPSAPRLRGEADVRASSRLAVGGGACLETIKVIARAAAVGVAAGVAGGALVAAARRVRAHARRSQSALGPTSAVSIVMEPALAAARGDAGGASAPVLSALRGIVARALQSITHGGVSDASAQAPTAAAHSATAVGGASAHQSSGLLSRAQALVVSLAEHATQLRERALDDAAVKARRDGSNAEDSVSGGRLKKRRLKREIRADIEKLADGLAMARASPDVRRHVANRDAKANGDAPPSADDRFTALAKAAAATARERNATEEAAREARKARKTHAKTFAFVGAGPRAASRRSSRVTADAAS